MKLNDFPEGFEGEQKRRTEFESPEDKLAYDAKGLIAKAKELYGKDVVTVRDAVDLATREGDDLSILRRAIAIELKNNVEAMAKASEKHELSPEDAVATLRTLEARFTAPENLKLHEGVSWDRVRVALESNPEALWSINKMQAAGHDPDVYDFDAEGFDIGTCSKESPASGRNCVYGRENAKWLRENRPDEKFNGSAEEMAEAMGIALMDAVKYKKVLQAKGKFDLETRSWLLTQKDILFTGGALYGVRYDNEVYVFRNFANFHRDSRAWRGSLRVKWAA